MVVDTMSVKSIATELEKIDVDVSMKSNALAPTRTTRSFARNRNRNCNRNQNIDDGNGMVPLLEQLDDCTINTDTLICVLPRVFS